MVAAVGSRPVMAGSVTPGLTSVLKLDLHMKEILAGRKGAALASPVELAAIPKVSASELRRSK